MTFTDIEKKLIESADEMAAALRGTLMLWGPDIPPDMLTVGCRLIGPEGAVSYVEGLNTLDDFMSLVPPAIAHKQSAGFAVVYTRILDEWTCEVVQECATVWGWGAQIINRAVVTTNGSPFQMQFGDPLIVNPCTIPYGGRMFSQSVAH